MTQLAMPPTRARPPRLQQLRNDLGGTEAANGLVALVFAATGPVAVILAVGTAGGLSRVEISSWIFAVFFLNGLITILASWAYRQPLSFFWTIPGTVVVGKSLTHLTWPEVLGAFIVTGILILVLGLTGWVDRVMSLIPLPLVMAMVAGVFLSFGTDLVGAVRTDVAIAAPMVLAFLLLSHLTSLGRWMPPVLGALLVGAVAVAVVGGFSPGSGPVLAAPTLQAPVFTTGALLELVVPLAITVLVVQNGQGVAVLNQAGHRPPINVATVFCGIGSLCSAAIGGISSCLTGPTNSLLVASGKRERHYAAAICCGALALVVGLFAPLFVRLMLATPAAYVATLGGLAMLRALQGAFVASFAHRFTLGALVTFLVTITDVTILNIGGAFWGIAIGFAVSKLLEPGDFDT
ncbi:MAG: benzoate/H(+) symporter BenE family transporter [Nocardioides sp.]|nr:benzoate/H(+) symporter BenE family transporter [Nocardioides sp.]